MRRLLFPLSSLLSGVGLLVVGVGLLFSVLGLRAGAANFSGVVTGLIMSAYFGGYVAGTFVCPLIIRRVGHIRAFAAMASIASTMPILHALWLNPWFWGGLRLITGMCLVGLYIVIESWLNELAPNHQRGKVFAIYMSVNFVALALGQWLILVGDRQGFFSFALVSVLFSFALLPITLLQVSEPKPVATPRLGLRALYAISPLGVVAAVSSGLLNGAFYGMGASYEQGVGLSTAGVAAFMAVTILGGAVFQWPVGHFSDRHDRRLVMLWVCIGSAALAGAGFFLSRGSELSLIALGAVYGGLVFTLYGLGVTHVNDVIDSSTLLEVTGGLLLMHGIGAAVGPTLAGVLMDAMGAESLMLFFALVLGLFALFIAHRMKFFPALPASVQADYVVMSSSSPVVLQMDPRAIIEEDGSEHAHSD